MVKEIQSVFECKRDKLKFKTIPVCSYQKDINFELREDNLSRVEALNLLEQMHMARALELLIYQSFFSVAWNGR